MVENEVQTTKPKKTNYQRLWRNASKVAVLKHNFANEILAASEEFVNKYLKKEEAEKWREVINMIEFKYTNMSKKLHKLKTE